MLTGLLALALLSASAQAPYVVSPVPGAQRNALSSVRTQVDWLQNSTRTAPNYGDQGYGNLWQSFQALRQSYTALKQTLTQEQLAAGADVLAELDAGLDILQQAFGNYQGDLQAGRNPRAALSDMSQVLRKGSTMWLQELNKRASQLRIGWR